MRKLQFCLIAFISTLFIITSCNKDNFDYDAYEREQRIKDSIENARIKEVIRSEKSALKTFADQHMVGASNVDSLGIWFKIIETGDNSSYTYSINNFGQIIAPTATVKYKGTLLNGTIFDQTTEDKVATFSIANVIRAWQIAFLPKSITFNGNTYPILGLTNNGLKKGSKIQVLTTSAYGYGTRSSEKIPANSPLYFEIEVTDIK